MKYEDVPIQKALLLESACAISSSALVAPIISIVDKSIFANASGKQPLVQGLISGFTTLFTKPLYFVRQPAFYLIWGVYSGTYIVANSVQCICDRKNVPWQIPKFIGSSAANVGLSVLKDLYFTRAFGTGAARPVPFASYSMYTMRDSMTIFASFNLPDVLSQNLTSNYGFTKSSADTTAQLVTPCAIQLFSTPLHLYGMDLYNRPEANKSERSTFIRREYVKTALARMGRIFPAFGIGGVANKAFRKKGAAWLSGNEH